MRNQIYFVHNVGARMESMRETYKATYSIRSLSFPHLFSGTVAFYFPI